MTAISTSFPPRVKLRQGAYVGKTRPSSTHYPKPLAEFLGVPFAQSTAGENRFRPPQPLPAVPPGDAADVAVVEFGQQCPGVLLPPEGVQSGEDCLNANIYVPANRTGDGARDRLLPVVVYVHGGAFNMGLGAERNMASFVSCAAEDVVGVSFNYRVGPLGFLPSVAAANEGVLNLGLMDQQMLFAWVQENIAEFGGDAGNVTVMGLSAGAHSIGHHLIYYATTAASAPAPFHKAILESGGPLARSVLIPTHQRHVDQLRDFLAALDIQNVPEADILQALRSLPVDDIHSAALNVWVKYSRSVCWPFQPTIDGVTIPDMPISSLRRGQVLKIPILTGYNTHEGANFVPAATDTDIEFRNFFKRLIPGASETEDLDPLARDAYPDPTTAAAAAQLYHPVPRGHGRQWARIEAAYAHYAYVCPVLQFADMLSAATTDSVYVYHFAPLSPPLATANHADNTPFAAHDAALLGPQMAKKAAKTRGDGQAPYPGLMAISDAMHSAYVRFIASRDGNPNAGATARCFWPPFESPSTAKGAATAGQVLVFGRGNDERLGPAGSGSRGIAAVVQGLSRRELELCSFWWDRVELSQGLGQRLPVRSPARKSRL
ncbi:hypothetical protein PgNI_05679 [Pyricularia grisea]|uniref:Carboxylic ester hydrolase n=1 Tax=Pyricularia grisea TaxID=148305 RepID=A0A6P8B3Z8_PYRGI|nr:hypothetical protein PgNI_05679 [Pyricularia grisea]TLD09970.1 hypothetical protein PgNI_05679 [Pyricularia grisea]